MWPNVPWSAVARLLFGAAILVRFFAATDTSSRFENVGYTVNQPGMAFMRV
jgi:hypothetical protein